jgi:hypothetical protein
VDYFQTFRQSSRKLLTTAILAESKAWATRSDYTILAMAGGRGKSNAVVLSSDMTGVLSAPRAEAGWKTGEKEVVS